jgi:hypothetical protein
VNNELKNHGRMCLWTNFKYYSGICMEELGKTTKFPSEDAYCSDQNLSPGHPKYKAENLTPASRLSVEHRIKFMTENND